MVYSLNICFLQVHRDCDIQRDESFSYINYFWKWSAPHPVVHQWHLPPFSVRSQGTLLVLLPLLRDEKNTGQGAEVTFWTSASSQEAVLDKEPDLRSLMSSAGTKFTRLSSTYWMICCSRSFFLPWSSLWQPLEGQCTIDLTLPSHTHF